MVQRMKGTLKWCDHFYEDMATSVVWKHQTKEGDNHHDPVQLARDMIERDVLIQNGFKGWVDQHGRTIDCVLYWKYANYDDTPSDSDDDLFD